jgi:transcriptional regulator with XRE-family HTH domain
MPQKPPPSWSAEEEELDVMLVILRSALRWKQNDLAGASGIGNSSISDYERRKKVPGRKNLRKLLDAMGYRPGVLDYTRRFLHELRTSQRLPEDEAGAAVVALDGAAQAAAADTALLARVEQVSSEAGRAAENLVRLALEIQLGKEGKAGSQKS